MRAVVVLMLAAMLVACFSCYIAGYRAGAKVSPMRLEREGQILYSLGAYQALETTNSSKLHGFVDIELLSCTRDYERRFGIPDSTNTFGKRFADAKVIADQVEKQLVPVGEVERATDARLQQQTGK